MVSEPGPCRGIPRDTSTASAGGAELLCHLAPFTVVCEHPTGRGIIRQALSCAAGEISPAKPFTPLSKLPGRAGHATERLQ